MEPQSILAKLFVLKAAFLRERAKLTTNKLTQIASRVVTA